MAIRYIKNGKIYEAPVVETGHFEVDAPMCHKVAAGIGFHLVPVEDAEVLA